MADTYPSTERAEGIPSSTIGTRIFIAEGSSTGSLNFTELTSITEVGELGGDAEDIDVTTLKQTERSYVPGVKDFPSVDVTLLMEDKETGNTDNYSALRRAELAGTLHCVQVLFPNKRGVQFFAKVKTKLNGASVNDALTFVASFYKKGDSTDVTWTGDGSSLVVTPVTSYPA